MIHITVELEELYESVKDLLSTFVSNFALNITI